MRAVAVVELEAPGLARAIGEEQRLGRPRLVIVPAGLGARREGQGAGLGTFYGDLFGDLAAGSVRAWAVAVGPLVLISLLRLIFLRKRIDSEPAGTDEDRPSPPRQKHPTPADPRRVEPRVSLD